MLYTLYGLYIAYDLLYMVGITLIRTPLSVEGHERTVGNLRHDVYSYQYQWAALNSWKSKEKDIDKAFSYYPSISIMMLEQNHDPATDLIHRAKSRVKNAKNPKFVISGKCLP